MNLRIWRRLAICVAASLWIGLIFTTSARAEEEVVSGIAEATVDEIEAIIGELLEAEKIPGLSLAIAKEGRLSYERGFGLADVEHEVAVIPETRFRTASIAKPMTSVLILKLMELERLDLDAAVQRYCPEYPEKKWPVTCRQLLGHLGGVRHYKSQAETRSTEHYPSLGAALEVFAADPLLHEPGTKFLYTTFGYNLLGNVAEGAGGSDFMSLLTLHVLEPAGMDSTVQDDHYAIVSHRSRGYMRASRELAVGSDGGGSLGLLRAPLHDTSVKIPGGGLLSTSGDLVRFVLALQDRRLLDESTCEMMWTAQRTRGGDSTGYGLGWGVARRKGERVVSHSGGQAGTSTFLYAIPERGVVVAIMCNLQGARLQAAAGEVAARVLGE